MVTLCYLAIKSIYKYNLSPERSNHHADPMLADGTNDVMTSQWKPTRLTGTVPVNHRCKCWRKNMTSTTNLSTSGSVHTEVYLVWCRFLQLLSLYSVDRETDKQMQLNALFYAGGYTKSPPPGPGWHEIHTLWAMLAVLTFFHITDICSDHTRQLNNNYAADYFVFRDSKTRGHKQKLNSSAFSRGCPPIFFCNRVVPLWNSLPEYVVLSPTAGLFWSNLNLVKC